MRNVKLCLINHCLLFQGSYMLAWCYLVRSLYARGQKFAGGKPSLHAANIPATWYMFCKQTWRSIWILSITDDESCFGDHVHPDISSTLWRNCLSVFSSSFTSCSVVAVAALFHPFPVSYSEPSRKKTLVMGTSVDQRRLNNDTAWWSWSPISQLARGLSLSQISAWPSQGHALCHLSKSRCLGFHHAREWNVKPGKHFAYISLFSAHEKCSQSCSRACWNCRFGKVTSRHFPPPRPCRSLA